MTCLVDEETDRIITEELKDITYEQIVAYNEAYRPSIIPKFEDMRPSTMTMVIFFEQEVEKMVVWHLLPIDYNPNFELKKKSIVWPGIAGLILNCRHKERQRGPGFKGAFRNSVTTDVTTPDKIVSAKISDFSIQMCGANSNQDGQNAANIIIDKIHWIFDNQIYFKEHPYETEKVIQYFFYYCKGEQAIKTCKELSTVVIQKPEGTSKKRKLSIYIIKNYLVHMFNMPPNETPEGLDPRIYQFFMNYARDIDFNNDSYEEFMRKITLVIQLPYVYPKYQGTYLTNRIKSVNEIMVNYNFILPTCIKREMLNYVMRKLSHLLIFSRYHQHYVNNVTIDYIYEDSNLDPRIKRNKQKPPHQTTIAYKTGAITQSSGGDGKGKRPYEILTFVYSRYQMLIEDRQLTEELERKKARNRPEIYKELEDILLSKLPDVVGVEF